MVANRSRLVALMAAGLCGLAAAVGCSASGTSDVGGATDDTIPDPSQVAQLPEAGEAGPSDPDASKPKPKDGGSKDSTVDAAPPQPVVGTSCATIDEVKKKPCGVCGDQETICLGAAGSGKWSEYGTCAKELANGCIPGTSSTESCGNCGARVKTCSQFCAFTTSVCAGEPASSCVPASIGLTSAGCTDPNTYRQRTCSAACVPSSFSLACEAAPTTIEVPPTIGSVSSTIAFLSEAQVAPRMLGTCPSGILSTTISTPYVYLSVHNPTAKSAVVSIYNSMAPGGAVIKTLLASYGPTVPTDDASRKACVKGTNSFGTAALTGNSSFASLDLTRAVTLGPDQTAVVYVAASNAFVAATPALSTGKVMLNVRTEQLN